jgi:hypothetical protein
VKVLGTIVDTGALLETVAASFVAGVGITFAFAFAILGMTRFLDLRADGRQLAATAFAVLGLCALAVCGAAIAFGLIVMTSD